MPNERERLVRAARDSKGTLHFVRPRGWGRGYEIACTGKKINRLKVNDVRAAHIRCPICQSHIGG